VMCPGCNVPMGVTAVIQDRPGTDSVTVTYECPICMTKTDRRHKGRREPHETSGPFRLVNGLTPRRNACVGLTAD